MVHPSAQSSPNPTVSAYNAEIAAQAKAEGGSAKRAALLLHELLGLGLKPESHTFTAVLDAVAKRPDGTAGLAYAILQKMAPFCEPNQIHFNATLNACANQRPAAIGIAEKVLEQLLAAGFRPSSYSLSALLRAAAFAEGAPRADLARAWFVSHATPAEINDHVVRALRRAVGDYEADELVGAARRPGSRKHSELADELERFGFGFGGGADDLAPPRSSLTPPRLSSPRHSSVSPPSSPGSSPRHSAEGPFAYQSRYSTTGWGDSDRKSSARQATDSDWRSTSRVSQPISERFSAPRVAGTSIRGSLAGSPARSTLPTAPRKAALLATPTAATAERPTRSSFERKSSVDYSKRRSYTRDALVPDALIPFPGATTGSGSTATTTTAVTVTPRMSSALLSPGYFTTPQRSSAAEATTVAEPPALQRRRSSFISPVLRQPTGPAAYGRGSFRASVVAAH